MEVQLARFALNKLNALLDDPLLKSFPIQQFNLRLIRQLLSAYRLLADCYKYLNVLVLYLLPTLAPYYYFPSSCCYHFALQSLITHQAIFPLPLQFLLKGDIITAASNFMT